MSMDIHSPKGTKVIYDQLNAGYDHDQETCREHLEFGKTYTVEYTEVHSWHTQVWLQEVPDVPFNSAVFSAAKSAGGK